MFLVAGLGNPGKEYSLSRHNAGFMVIDDLIERFNCSNYNLKFQSAYSEIRFNGERLIFQKPLTYMNNSGIAVRDLANFYKIEPENIIVAVDDVDIEPLSLRIRAKGSAGTHNGLKSIIYHLQSDNFIRIKLGVGRKHQNEDLAKFVLSNFSKEFFSEFRNTVSNAADAVEDIVLNGIDHAMNKYNVK